MILVVLLIALLSGLIAGVITRSRSAFRRLTIDPPPRMMPGNRLPPDASCSWYTVQGNVASCNMPVNDGIVYMSYNPFQHAIIETIMKPVATTVGDVVLAWGTPTGCRKIGNGTQIYWPGRSVYTASGQLTPIAPVESISFVPLSTDYYPAWRGFIHIDHEDKTAPSIYC